MQGAGRVADRGPPGRADAGGLENDTCPPELRQPDKPPSTKISVKLPGNALLCGDQHE